MGILDSFRDLGPAAPFVFAAAYAAAAVLLVPATLFTLAAGALFGVAKGLATVSAGSTAGAGLSFLVGRYLARERVARMLESRPRLKAVDAAVARDGWKVVFLLRLSPLVPYNLFNYAMGVSSIGFKEYLLASWVGMLPGALLYVWLGAAGADLARGQRTPAQQVLSVIGVLATGLAVWLISRRARAALRECSQEH